MGNTPALGRIWNAQQFDRLFHSMTARLCSCIDTNSTAFEDDSVKSKVYSLVRALNESTYKTGDDHDLVGEDAVSDGYLLLYL